MQVGKGPPGHGHKACAETSGSAGPDCPTRLSHVTLARSGCCSSCRHSARAGQSSLSHSSTTTSASGGGCVCVCVCVCVFVCVFVCLCVCVCVWLCGWVAAAGACTAPGAIVMMTGLNRITSALGAGRWQGRGTPPPSNRNTAPHPHGAPPHSDPNHALRKPPTPGRSKTPSTWRGPQVSEQRVSQRRQPGVPLRY